jgi:hypothetical protein
LLAERFLRPIFDSDMVRSSAINGIALSDNVELHDSDSGNMDTTSQLLAVSDRLHSLGPESRFPFALANKEIILGVEPKDVVMWTAIGNHSLRACVLIDLCDDGVLADNCDNQEYLSLVLSIAEKLSADRLEMEDSYLAFEILLNRIQDVKDDKYSARLVEFSEALAQSVLPRLLDNIKEECVCNVFFPTCDRDPNVDERRRERSVIRATIVSLLAREYKARSQDEREAIVERIVFAVFLHDDWYDRTLSELGKIDTKMLAHVVSRYIFKGRIDAQRLKYALKRVNEIVALV